MESEYLELYKSVVSEISKGMEQVKESCSNKEQEGVLERMLSSHEEALLILTGRAPRGKCDSGISSLPDPPAPASSTSVRGSKDASTRLWKRKTITDIYRVKDETSYSHQDGFAWRKYGQKNILGAKYPRAYYKCVHALCRARKEVQRSDDGTVFEVTYTARHTCLEGLSKIIQDGSQKEKKVIEAEQEQCVEEADPEQLRAKAEAAESRCGGCVEAESNPEELEIEIAEVLYGLMSQSQAPSSKKEESREINRLGSDAKSHNSSPISNSPSANNPSLGSNSGPL